MMSLHEYASRLAFGEAAAFENLVMVPVMETGARPEPGYLLLQEALEAKLARVTEVGGGTVPELVFENLADCPVLLLGGEELVGAKQNRMLNLTILAAPRSKIVIPVSCVEAGRWHMDTPEFAPSDFMAFSAVRAGSTARVTASMRMRMGRRTDQGEVWSVIEERFQDLGARSPTGAMRAIYEKRLTDVEKFVGAMPPRPGQIGAAFLIGGELAGIDVFDHPQTMERMTAKLVRGYAVDALAAQQARREESAPEGSGAPGKPDSAAVAENIRQWLSALETEGRLLIEPAVGMGQDVRFENERISAAALWAEERFVHFCAFPLKDGSGRLPPTPQSWLVSDRLRRRGGGRFSRGGPPPDVQY
jgi:hypothetical protein